MGRWQRFNPAALTAVREHFGWSPERMALRLRVWQLIERLNLEVAPGAGLAALRAYVDQDNLDGLGDPEIADVEAFLSTTASKLGNAKTPRSNLSGVTIRRWEAGETLPMVAQLHVILDALNFEAAMLFEPSNPGKPKLDPKQMRDVGGKLDTLAQQFRAAHVPHKAKPLGRPRKPKSGK